MQSSMQMNDKIRKEKDRHISELAKVKEDFDKQKKRLEVQLKSSYGQLEKERRMWLSLASEAKRDVNLANEKRLDEKKRSRNLIQEQITKGYETEKVMLAHIAALDELTFELEGEVATASRDYRRVLRGKKKANSRLDEWKQRAVSKQGVIDELRYEVEELIFTNKEHEDIYARYNKLLACNRKKEMIKV